MEKIRCPWCLGDELYMAYHDEEWGRPCHDDRVLFEFLVLEGAQAGLSWITVLKRRDGYRRAFAGFDPEKVAGFDNEQIEHLMQNQEIVRNRAKIKSAVQNAAAFLRVREAFGSFDNYIWRFSEGEPIVNRFRMGDPVPAETDLSRRISKDLKKRGFSFVGPTICYAYMQAVGIVNDHYLECWLRNEEKNQI